LLAFAPMGFFIPMLMGSKIRNWLQFTLLMIVVVFFVELIQFIFNVGIADVDDIILNTLGALIVYGLMQMRLVKSMLRKIEAMK